MSRAGRILIDNACYHIITRGNQKQSVFRENKDFDVYLAILRKAKRKYEICIYAYCLMPNHAHLLVEPKEAKDISLFMHWINRGYAAYFNETHETVGHLWQGRFISKPIVKGYYLINCASYIEANPLRASLVDDIAQYPWSSYSERCLMPTKVFLDEMRTNENCDSAGTL